MHSSKHLLIAPIASVLFLLLAACSDTPKTNTDDTKPRPDPAGSATMQIEQNLPPELGQKPSVQVTPGQPAPQDLVIKDLIVGTGAEADPGKTVVVNYVGVSQTTGREFDSSWSRNQPFTFQLGAGKVIPGWDRGVAGMKAGGRRELVIPPDLAYGSRGAGGAIGPNETLVFVVDLLEVK